MTGLNIIHRVLGLWYGAKSTAELEARCALLDAQAHDQAARAYKATHDLQEALAANAELARQLAEAVTRTAQARVPHWSEGLPDDHPDMIQLRANRAAAANLRGR